MRINLKVLRRRQRQAGVTLMEALVSMGIFGVSFFSLYAGMSMGFAVIGNARENLRATQIMVEKMETIRLYSWDQINTPGFIPATFTESYFPAGSSGGSGGTTQTSPSTGGGTSGGDGVTAQTITYVEGGNTDTATESNSSPGVIYLGSLTIANGPVGQSYGGDIRRITLNVTWTSHGRTHNRSMSTYVSRHGLQNYIY